jgi:hypothetical protein
LKGYYEVCKGIGEPGWDAAQVLTDFSYPWHEDAPASMTFQALWKDDLFCFRFDVLCDPPLISRINDHKMEVVDSDRVEIFFRSNEQMDPYYCLEMDAAGRVLDYQARHYRQFDYPWKWPGNNQLQVKSKITPTGYYVEGSVSLSSLRTLNLLQNNKMQVGLFRGECIKTPSGEQTFKWISWIKPDSPIPDFHIPSAFGEIELSL